MEYTEWLQSRAGQEPRRYAHPQVRAALAAETSSKCAYCEGFISDVSYPNVEHKAPKRKYPDLVCAWDNLTLACHRCNTNKGDYDDPTCPLLDPYVDDVESEIAFGGPFAMPRGGARARASISRLDLNRKDLLGTRAEKLQALYDLLDLVQRSADSPDVQAALWLDVDRRIGDAAEFASACRYFVEAECAERGLSRPEDNDASP